MLDDFPNLEVLGDSGGVHDWNNFRAYLFGGFSGPTGRPLSLLSFLLDARNWPADPEPFKRTNLLIHLATATVLWQMMRALLKQLPSVAGNREALALLAAGMWLLHPYLLSTTMYIVQRMTQLSTFFVLAGLWGYLHGRMKLEAHPGRAYAWMSLSLIFGTLLGTLSKENGALLPLLALVVEWILRGNSPQPKPARAWVAVFMALPGCAVLGYLALRIDFSSDSWFFRPFNQEERLWTQARVVWDYIGNLLAPRIEGYGLYSDDFPVSTGWLEPVSTLIASIGIMAMLVAGIALRRRMPLLSLALVFFLAAHVMESSVLPLELYYEHRNYMPAAMLFLPLAALVSWSGIERKSLSIVAGSAIFILLAFMLHARAVLWSDTDNLETYWSVNRPYSVRAQVHMVKKMVKENRPEDANRFLEDIMRVNHDSVATRLMWLLNRMEMDKATPEDFEKTAHLMRTGRLDVQSYMVLEIMNNFVLRESANDVRIKGLLSIMRAATENRKIDHFPAYIKKLATWSQFRLLLIQGNMDAARQQMRVTLNVLDDVDEALKIISLATEHQQLRKDALDMMPLVRKIYDNQPAVRMSRPPEEYRDEIDYIENLLREDIAAAAKEKP